MANYDAANLDAWARKIDQELNRVVAAVCMDLSSKVILRTPVDTGRARANWKATIDLPSSGTTLDTDKSGTSAIKEAERVSLGAAGNIFYLTNNLPYIGPLEYGSSQQAPRGMVRITVSEFNAAVRKAAKR